MRAPGRYRLVLARDPPPGRHVVEVAVRDAPRNADRAGFRVEVSAG